jgi:hypothetical protein
MLTASPDAPDAYSVKFAELRRNLVKALGSDTVNVVLRRGVREIAPVYPGFRLTPTDDGLQLTWQPDPLAEHSDEFIRAAYSALYAAMLVILARILGREIAVRLASAVDAERVLQGHSIE